MGPLPFTVWERRRGKARENGREKGTRKIFFGGSAKKKEREKTRGKGFGLGRPEKGRRGWGRRIKTQVTEGA